MEALSRSTTSASQPSNRWIEPDQLNRIKEDVNIVDVVEAYQLPHFSRTAPLKATAVCPFHNDHRPSLSIDGTRGLVKCFACGAGGDVFWFVRQMENDRNNQQTMSFYDAVRHVQQEFLQGDSWRQNLPSSTTATNMTASSFTASIASTAPSSHQLERLYQANAAAAAFYSQALTEPSAGTARTHLQARRIAPSTTRTFALGWAPDVYYGHSDSTATSWGAGSLVEFLQQGNFTPAEVVAAGLAIPTQRWRRQQQQQQPPSGNATPEQREDSATGESFEGLMDRFRGRIVVPIFDATGKRVLGFGGRILDETPDEDRLQSLSSDYIPPKYLNSPESPIFQKKQVLFGLHLTREEHVEPQMSREESTAILLVEGYIDAISLHSVGISGVVASMGTAVSPEQLLAAALAASRREGPLILCLDADEAGQNATERLCANGLIAELLDKCRVDVRVAHLPEGMKDPAEFVEAQWKKRASRDKVIKDFHQIVTQKAEPWVDWYIQRQMARYSSTAEPGQEGSLRFIIDRLADFINTCTNHVDRETMASNIAASLTELIAQSTNETSVSDTVRNQLESDLLRLSVGKGLAREAAIRGGMDYDMVEREGSVKNRLRAALARGYGPTSEDKRGKISSHKLVEVLRNENELPVTTRPPQVLRREDTVPTSTGSRRKQARSSLRVKRVSSVRSQPSLIPHFSGFKFQHEADAAWLGAKKRGASLVLGLPRDKYRFVGKDELYPWSNKPVYFNSNDYLGHQFLTDEAVQAGYRNTGVVKNTAIVEKGVGILVRPDVPRIQTTTENELLSLLIRNGPARVSVKNWLDSQRAVHSENSVHWTCPLKEWLFDCLVQNMADIPPNATDANALYLYLAGRSDAPPGALSLDFSNATLQENEASIGALDYLFLKKDVQETGLTYAQHGDALAQELLATLVWSSTLYHSQRIKFQLDHALAELEKLPFSTNLTVSNADATTDATNTVTANATAIALKSRLESQCTALTRDYWHTQRSLHSLAQSASRVRHKLLEGSKASWGIRSLSKEAQKEFEDEMDDFVQNYSPPLFPVEVQALIDSSDTLENEPYEDLLERLEERWSNWLDDDTGSQPEATVLPPILNEHHMDDDIEETHEEAMARLQEVWGDWLEEEEEEEEE